MLQIPAFINHLVIRTNLLLRAVIMACLAALPVASTAQVPGDVAPRSSTDGQLNAGDAVVLQRIVTGLLTPTLFEQLSGDIAPLGSPDSLLDVADLLLLIRAINGEVVLVDNLPPLAADTSLITVTDTGTGTVDFNGAAGSVEGNGVVEVVNYQTGATASVTANSDGSFFITLAGLTGDAIGITVTDSASNVGPQTQVGVGQLLAITITSPTDGAVIANDRAQVSGTYSGPAGAAITVNGVTACTNGSTFYAVDVPIDTNGTSLEARVAIADGLSLTDSVNVSSSGPSPVQVEVALACGYAPHTVNLAVTNNTSANLQTLTADFDNDGTTDLTVNNPSTGIQYTYTAQGVYQAAITVMDDQGGVYNSLHPVQVDPLTDIDTYLRSIYNSMRDRLRVGSIDGALNYLDPEISGQFETVFNALSLNLSTIVDQLGVLDRGVIIDDYAEYLVIRGTRAYPLTFTRDENGVWRISGM